MFTGFPAEPSHLLIPLVPKIPFLAKPWTWCPARYPNSVCRIPEACTCGAFSPLRCLQSLCFVLESDSFLLGCGFTLSPGFRAGAGGRILPLTQIGVGRPKPLTAVVQFADTLAFGVKMLVSAVFSVAQPRVRPTHCLSPPSEDETGTSPGTAGQIAPVDEVQAFK